MAQNNLNFSGNHQARVLMPSTVQPTRRWRIHVNPSVIASFSQFFYIKIKSK